jgi:hypothetical protein
MSIGVETRNEAVFKGKNPIFIGKYEDLASVGGNGLHRGVDA